MLNMNNLWGLIALFCLQAHAQSEDPCDVTKGCFRDPEDCYPPSTCKYFVAWNPNADSSALIDFELSVEVASGETYAAVGFSENNLMIDSDVYVCRSDETLQRYYTGGYSSGTVTTSTNKGLSNIAVDSVTDGVLHCTFSRNIDLDDGDTKFFSLNSSLYVIVATSTRSGDTLDYHGSNNRWRTSKAVDFSMAGDPTDDQETQPSNDEDPCDVTQGCFRDPDNCYPPSTCRYFVAWNLNADSSSLVDFELSVEVVSGDTYTAIGLSKNKLMTDSDVYVCRSDGTLQRYYTGGYTQQTVTTSTNKGLSDIVVDSVIDGVLHCTFTRNIDLDDGDAQFFSLNSSLYVIVATSTRSGDTLDYHGSNNRWLKSEAVDFSMAGDPTDDQETQPSNDEDPCDVTQGCFRDPEDCYPPSTCRYFVAWNLNADSSSLVDFELSVEVASGDTYTAIGLSKNNLMTDSDVYVCRSDGTLQRYYTGGYTQQTVTTSTNKGLSDIVVDSVIDGVLHCTFSRNIDLDDGDAQFFSLNSSLYVIVATSTRSGDTLDYHGSQRWRTSSAVDFSAITSVVGDQKLPRTKKAHGILMVIGWMLFASTGILFARYMKPFLPDSTLFGGKVWFNSHRICMISALLFFAVAFIAIFAVKGEFVQSENKTAFAHAIVGCFAVGFGTINPIMAIFRPHPGTPRRPYFNYLHRTVGLSGWAFAMAAIILACVFYIDPAVNTIVNVSSVDTMISFLVIALIVIVIFEIFIWKTSDAKTQNANQSTDIAMQSAGDANAKAPSNTTDPKPCERWRITIFCIALVAIVICTIIMIANIAKVDI